MLNLTITELRSVAKGRNISGHKNISKNNWNFHLNQIYVFYQDLLFSHQDIKSGIFLKQK